MSERRTRDQQRARWAYEAVRRAHGGGDGDGGWSRYQGVVMGLPVVILRCGLVGAVAWLYRHKGVGLEVCRDLAKAGVPGLGGEPEQLLTRVCALPLSQYMVATREVLALAGWLKRAAQAMPERELRAPEVGSEVGHA